MRIEPQWEECCFFSDGRAVVKKKGKYGTIDSLGHYLVPPKYDDLLIIGKNRLLASVGAFREGIIDDHDSVIVPLNARWITFDADSVLGCVMKDSVFVCDYNGKAILERKYNVLDDGLGGAARFGMFIVIPHADWKKRRDNCMGYIVVDTADQQVVPGRYDHIALLGDSVFECENKDSIFYFDLKGNAVADPYTIEVRIRDRSLPYPGYKATSPSPPRGPFEGQYETNEKGDARLKGWKDRYGTEYWED